jgi:hypothetical protein
LTLGGGADIAPEARLIPAGACITGTDWRVSFSMSRR